MGVAAMEEADNVGTTSHVQGECLWTGVSRRCGGRLGEVGNNG